MPYLAEGPRPDVSMARGDLNSGRILLPLRLFESDLNNGPSPDHSDLKSDEVYICSSLLFMVSWQVPYVAKGRRSDFNNGLRDDWNSGPILGPRRLFESDLSNGPSSGHSGTELQT